MIVSNAFDFVNVLGKAMDASWARETAINNNIANVSTPNYKRQDVSFESIFANQLNVSSTGSLREAVSEVSLRNLGYKEYTDMANLSYRLDGNNVDIDTENTELASEQIRYEGLQNSVNYEFNMIKTAIQRT